MRILSSLNRKSNGRSGASLTEVLIAILILSIGVSSVFALFPISILSSIKATQLTNAKLMQGNVEQYIRTNPGYLTVNVRPTNISDGNKWQAQTTYAAGDLVVPTPKNGSYRSEPFRIFRAIPLQWLDSDPTNPTIVPIPTRLTEPNWAVQAFLGSRVVLEPPVPIRTSIGGGDFQNNVIVWEPVDTPVVAQLFNPTTASFNSWVVDPLGAAVFGSAGDGTAPAGEFGCFADSTGTTGNSVTAAGVGTWVGGLPRTNASIATHTPVGVNEAYGLAAHADAWSESARVTAITNSALTTNEVELQPTENFFVGSRFSRVIVRNADGTRSVTRTGTSVSYIAGSPGVANRLSIIGQPIPTSIWNDLGEVSVEEFDARYTWFITVNNSIPNNPTIKMAVVFKRKFLPGEEHVYQSSFGVSPGGSVVVERDQIYVTWTASEPRPHIQEGKYVMRARPDGPGVEWYKIVSANITEISTVNPTGSALITVDREVNAPTRAADAPDRAILLRGIVELFDL
ncbi:MAG: hypothetical protein R3C18_05600 [Planctomycetaceae bacterium]